MTSRATPQAPYTLASAAETPPSALDVAKLYATVVKLVPTTADASGGLDAPRSTATLAAMQQLIEMVDQLRSPASGWPANVPQTPENLVPYVLDETQDVMDALQSQNAAIGLTTQTEAPELAEPDPWQAYFLLEELAPWVLWCAASSSFEVMALMEGIAGHVLQSDRGWQTGILRLVPLLEVEAPGVLWRLDLTTRQLPPPLLDLEMTLQSNAVELQQQQIRVTELLQRLSQQMQITVPVVAPFLNRVRADVLAPNRNWQPGAICLRLGVEFTADGDRPSQAMTPAELPSAPQPLVKFSDVGWRMNYSSTVVRQQLSNLLPQLPSLQAAAEPSPPQEHNQLATALVKDACAASDRLQAALTNPDRNFVQQEIGFSDLSRRLLWCLSRSSYEVMQLMSGIHGRLLQRESDWQNGTVRLLVSLKLKTPELDWHLDLATGESPRPSIFPLEDMVIFTSVEHRWCHQPGLVEQLKQRVLRQINRTSPEIQLLLEGTSADLQPSGNAWQPGALKLQAEFEFMPDVGLLDLP